MERLLTVRIAPYLITTGIVIGVTLTGLPVRVWLEIVSISLLYLLVVAGIALRFGQGPSITAAIIAFLFFNFFYVPPYYTLDVATSRDISALIVFLIVGILISQLVVRVRQRTLEAIRRGRQTETLYQLSVVLIREDEPEQILRAIVERVRQVFELSTAAVMLESPEKLDTPAFDGEPLAFEDRNLTSLAHWVIANRSPAGIGARRVRLHRPSISSQRPAEWPYEMLFIPIVSGDDALGILLVARERGQRAFDEEELRLLSTFANQAAIAIERGKLAEERTRAEVLARTDELKTAMLAAVSHDLRTPLASIKAAVSTLLQPTLTLPDDGQHDLLETIDAATDRLNRLVQSLLDLRRIEAGVLRPAVDWYDASEIVRQALDQSQIALASREIIVDLPEPAPLLEVDEVMIVETLVNLLENAGRYTPAGTPITLSGTVEAGWLTLRIADEGPGIRAGHEERIFDHFYRVQTHQRMAGSGSGLGLPIARGFVEAHGGRIWVERNSAGGATFALTLPLANVAEAEPQEATTRGTP